MRTHTPALLLVAGLGTVFFAPAGLAADAPMRKSGLWEIRTETTAGGQKMSGPMTMSGMPGTGSGGEFRMDPEMMKRMQQQYGR